ncbi:phosphate ABC transporter permease PstA [Alteromonas sp. CYL-A6]|uniref:phosphate ABC transporter permease PstA n=1 Tax=Alteromonas nitratireducens TaxID=3390813 RepID=UPI0034BC40FB
MAEFLRHITTSAQRQSFVVNLSAFLCSLLLLVLISILTLIIVRGTGYFWPQPVMEVTYTDQRGLHSVYARTQAFDENSSQVWRVNFSDQAFPFGSRLLLEPAQVVAQEVAIDAAAVHLNDGRVMLARPESVVTPDGQFAGMNRYQTAHQAVARVLEQIEQIRVTQLAPIHEQLAEYDRRDVEQDAPARDKLRQAFDRWHSRVLELEQQRDSYRLRLRFADNAPYELALADIASIDFVGQLSVAGKLGVVFSNIGVFLTESPKQANTSGGVYPALFGTVLMVFLMTIIVTPFGVLAAVYLSEYAPDNTFTAAIRISVSNMAGVPSIVYGVFGLGFFVYTVGGSIDALFFADRLPAPTMGTPGVFWASLTMALLTLPVVIVATEEGLRRVPEGLKAGSYALGATKAETLFYTILPIASPGIMTGVILAIARAAGEVAPLMLVGAVKFAPNLPVDGEFPYLHLDRQFMHLGVLIYDGAFHSQTDAKGAPMMFAACLLLLLVVFVLNILAALLRTRLRKRYLIG